MQNRLITLLIFSLLSINFMQAAERFLYVNDFKNILDNPTRRTELLAYAQSHQINELILYELHLVNSVHNLSNAQSNQILADFISSAKTTYGISKISAAGESAAWFQSNIITYNATRAVANEKFDALGLEFEFWTPSAVSMYYCSDYLIPNSLPCDSAGAFVFCKNQLTQMKALTAASTHPMAVEMYVGWPNLGQLHTLSAIADKMFIHAYVANPSTSFNYALTRLNYYANYSGTANVYIIFSSEPDFMQSWLSTHSIVEAENIFTTSYNAASGPWKSHVNFAGFVYFTYTFQTNIALPIHWIKTAGKRTGKAIKLDWIIKNTEGLSNFNIERSLDGKTWDIIAIVDKNERQFIDNEGITKPVYYRLQANILRGVMETSPVIALESALSNEKINVFPNPFKEEIVLPDLPIEALYLVNSQGQKQTIRWDGSSKITDLNRLPEGVYVLWILANGRWTQVKMVKE
jgi:hypothetical protein